MDPETGTLFFALLALVAFLYASVGHGGASGYLALMALYGFAPAVMKPTALMLNIGVSLIAFIQYYRGGHFSWKLFLPLAIASVPAAFVGGLTPLPSSIYKQILGLFLLFPAARFLYSAKPSATTPKTMHTGWALLIGAGIGLLSGMIGIGGGILLSPLLVLLGWADLKQAAAVSALFIFVNSLAGLGGLMQQEIHFSPLMYTMAGLAMLGGVAGSYFGALQFRQQTLRIILALVLFIAALKLLFT